MIDDIVVLTFVIYAVVLLLYLIENLPQYFFLYKYVVYNVDNTCMPLIIHLLHKQDFSFEKSSFEFLDSLFKKTERNNKITLLKFCQNKNLCLQN